MLLLLLLFVSPPFTALTFDVVAVLFCFFSHLSSRVVLFGDFILSFLISWPFTFIRSLCVCVCVCVSSHELFDVFGRNARMRKEFCVNAHARLIVVVLRPHHQYHHNRYCFIIMLMIMIYCNDHHRRHPQRQQQPASSRVSYHPWNWDIRSPSCPIQLPSSGEPQKNKRPEDWKNGGMEERTLDVQVEIHLQPPKHSKDSFFQLFFNLFADFPGVLVLLFFFVQICCWFGLNWFGMAWFCVEF